jgi:hypothetical protein
MALQATILKALAYPEIKTLFHSSLKGLQTLTTPDSLVNLDTLKILEPIFTVTWHDTDSPYFLKKHVFTITKYALAQKNPPTSCFSCSLLNRLLVSPTLHQMLLTQPLNRDIGNYLLNLPYQMTANTTESTETITETTDFLLRLLNLSPPLIPLLKPAVSESLSTALALTTNKKFDILTPRLLDLVDLIPTPTPEALQKAVRDSLETLLLAVSSSTSTSTSPTRAAAPPQKRQQVLLRRLIHTVYAHIKQPSKNTDGLVPPTTLQARLVDLVFVPHGVGEGEKSAEGVVPLALSLLVETLPLSVEAWRTYRNGRPRLPSKLYIQRQEDRVDGGKGEGAVGVEKIVEEGEGTSSWGDWRAVQDLGSMLILLNEWIRLAETGTRTGTEKEKEKEVKPNRQELVEVLEEIAKFLVAIVEVSGKRVTGLDSQKKKTKKKEDGDGEDESGIFGVVLDVAKVTGGHVRVLGNLLLVLGQLFLTSKFTIFLSTFSLYLSILSRRHMCTCIPRFRHGRLARRSFANAVEPQKDTPRRCGESVPECSDCHCAIVFVR